MRIPLIAALCAILASAAPPTRPPITGVAHIALFSRDVNRSRAFYKDFLGYAEPFSLNNADGSLSLTFFKVNDRQYIELFPEAGAGTERLAHIGFQTVNADGLRAYLGARGIPVPPRISEARIGNLNFTVKDPDGNVVEFVQYVREGWTAEESGKSLGSGRVSDRLLHVGILAGQLERSLKFYRDLLGFRETWRGSADGKVLSWVNLQVPDGSDYIELMLYRDLPPPAGRGTAQHLCLAVPDIARAIAGLDEKPSRAAYTRSMEPRIGRNRKRQVNLFDPDGTRVELMEPQTVDDQPAPSSTAPPPR